MAKRRVPPASDQTDGGSRLKRLLGLAAEPGESEPPTAAAAANPPPRAQPYTAADFSALTGADAASAERALRAAAGDLQAAVNAWLDSASLRATGGRPANTAPSAPRLARCVGPQPQPDTPWRAGTMKHRVAGGREGECAQGRSLGGD